MEKLFLVLSILSLSTCASFQPGTFEQTGKTWPPLAEDALVRVFEDGGPVPAHREIGRYILEEPLGNALDSGSPYRRLLIAKQHARTVGGNGIIVFRETTASRGVMVGKLIEGTGEWEWSEAPVLRQEYLILRLGPE